MRFLKWLTALCVLTGTVVGVLLAYRAYLLNSQDVVARNYWPRELVGIINESASRGDVIEGVDVRYAGFITTYVWRMPSTESRLNVHLEQFKIAAVSASGIEHERIVSRWPHAWDVPSTDFDMYANPIGLPGANDGECEFVLLHDKGKGTIYFYYYFNF